MYYCLVIAVICAQLRSRLKLGNERRHSCYFSARQLRFAEGCVMVTGEQQSEIGS